MGKSDIAALKNLMEDREDVDGVDTLKTEYLGTHTLKISANVKYDFEEISEKLVLALEKEVAQIGKTENQRELIRKILVKSSDSVLAHTTDIIKDVENDIKKEFPHITEIDLEQSKSNIHEPYRGLMSLTSSESESEENE